MLLYTYLFVFHSASFIDINISLSLSLIEKEMAKGSYLIVVGSF